MKGPFERLKYDLRRIWECPACGAKQRTEGSVTTRFCACGKPNSSPSVAMKMVSDGPRRTVPPIPPPVIEPEREGEAPAEPSVAVAVTHIDVIAAPAATIVVVTEVDVLPPIDPTEPSP